MFLEIVRCDVDFFLYTYLIYFINTFWPCKLFHIITWMFLLNEIYEKIVTKRFTFGLYDLYGYGSSKFLIEKMICHKIYIYNLCGFHVFYEYGSLNSLLEKMIYHKIHICNLGSWVHYPKEIRSIIALFIHF